MRPHRLGNASGPAQGVGGSDIPTQSSGKLYGGVVKDTLSIGKIKRERAPAEGATGWDNRSLLLDMRGGCDVMDTSETMAGK